LLSFKELIIASTRSGKNQLVYCREGGRGGKGEGEGVFFLRSVELGGKGIALGLLETLTRKRDPERCTLAMTRRSVRDIQRGECGPSYLRRKSARRGEEGDYH